MRVSHSSAKAPWRYWTKMLPARWQGLPSRFHWFPSLQMDCLNLGWPLTQAPIVFSSEEKGQIVFSEPTLPVTRYGDES